MSLETQRRYSALREELVYLKNTVRTTLPKDSTRDKVVNIIDQRLRDINHLCQIPYPETHNPHRKRTEQYPALKKRDKDDMLRRTLRGLGISVDHKS